MGKITNGLILIIDTKDKSFILSLTCSPSNMSSLFLVILTLNSLFQLNLSRRINVNCNITLQTNEQLFSSIYHWMEQNSITTQLIQVIWFFKTKIISLTFSPGSKLVNSQSVNNVSPDKNQQNIYIILNSNDQARLTCSLFTKQKNNYIRDIIFTDKHE